jgi:hypothetical protein
MSPMASTYGAAISARNGQARHEVSIQGGYFKDGLGFRFNGAWKASTWVDGGSTGGQRSTRPGIADLKARCGTS